MRKSVWVNGLDAIRFVLAFVVLLSHIGVPYAAVLKASHQVPVQWAGYVLNNMFCGAAAVTVFFVISGFVIHYPHRGSRDVDVLSFLVRRWVRVGIPLLVVATVAYANKQTHSIPIWSLYCELFYYTVYPVLYRWRLSWEAKLKWAYALSAVLIVAVICDEWASAKLGRAPVCTGATWVFAVALINLPAWLWGVWLAQNLKEATPTPALWRVYAMRTLIVGCAMVSLILKSHFHIKYLYTQVIFALPAVYWIKAEICYRRHRPIGRISEFLGRFSYTLYLWHILLASWLVPIFPKTPGTWPLLVLAVLATAYLIYLLVERPSHRLARWLAEKVAKQHTA